ncbi:MAG: aldehyde dehydrogenase family protein [Chthonomonadales bacterium]
MRRYRSYIAGSWRPAEEYRPIINPFDGAVVAECAVTSPDQLAQAMEAAQRGFDTMRTMPAFRRKQLLLRLLDALRERREYFARIIVEEAGKPISDARAEVERALNVLELGAEETARIGGELIPLDRNPTSAGTFAVTRRYPLGPVAAITPFNFPLNLGMHKIVPALAAGNSVVWKPSPVAPGPAFEFASLAHEAGLPPGSLNVVTPSDDTAPLLVTDERMRLLSFTGSAAVGWRLRSLAGRKRVVLELGGAAAAIVTARCDLEHAVERCLYGAFAYSGQICISVQRLFIENSVYRPFLERFLAGAQALTVGDPASEDTRIGPLISDAAAERIERWIAEATAEGAKVLAGGTRSGRVFHPTVIEGASPQMKVFSEEVFGPVVTVAPFSSLDDALDLVNRTPWGLQAGIFTNDLDAALRAFEALEVGSVIVNDVPTYRSDAMPYGGEKASGLGREGVRYAIEAMTALRTLVLRRA